MTKHRWLHVSASTLAVVAAGAAQHFTAAAESRDNAELTLPPGFKATVFAEHIGHARQMVVSQDGTLYVNTWSGVYYNDKEPPPGAFLYALRDTSSSGKADAIKSFGPTGKEGNHGGTGIALYQGKLYAESNDKIVRYDLPAGTFVPRGKPETIVSGIPITGDHPMHPFITDGGGSLYTSVGSATNSCQEQNRSLESPGIKDCPELQTRAGIWRYDANKTDQVFSPKERYATGLRNGEGLAFDAQGRLFVTQHGRDQLFENWPRLYKDQKQGAELPSEELMEVTKGADYGWPFCYYDGYQEKLVLAPEYGGDGGKKVGLCAEKTPPIAAFPAHIAPNDLAINFGKMFPKAYVGAAFIAFHGSWNRAPSPQRGYNVIVQPLENGHASGKWEIFADGFAGAIKTPAQAEHRPSGLAFAPDGSLYISDDVKGTIWRITYSGDPDAKIEPAPAVASATRVEPTSRPPEGVHPDAGALQNAALLKAPDGTTKEEILLGSKIFHGEAQGGTCATCHGTNLEGLPIGPELIKKEWLWSDGSLKGIAATIDSGVEKPKSHPGMMPPRGGASLDDSDVKALAAYIYALNHQG